MAPTHSGKENGGKPAFTKVTYTEIFKKLNSGFNSGTIFADIYPCRIPKVLSSHQQEYVLVITNSISEW